MSLLQSTTANNHDEVLRNYTERPYCAAECTETEELISAKPNQSSQLNQLSQPSQQINKLTKSTIQQINFYPVKFFAEDERSEFKRGLRPEEERFAGGWRFEAKNRFLVEVVENKILKKVDKKGYFYTSNLKHSAALRLLPYALFPEYHWIHPNHLDQPSQLNQLLNLILPKTHNKQHTTDKAQLL